MGYFYLAITITLTVYGQMIVKWRVDEAGDLGTGASGKLDFVGRLLSDPWVLTALVAAFAAALTWFAALTQLELSRAYPFAGLTFAAVLVGSALFFSEPLTVLKVAGVALIIGGVAVASQG